MRSKFVTLSKTTALQPASNKQLVQGLSQLQSLRRQFVPLKPLEGDKKERLRDNVLIVIANNSKCNAVLKFKQPLPLKKGLSFSVLAQATKMSTHGLVVVS